MRKSARKEAEATAVQLLQSRVELVGELADAEASIRAKEEQRRVLDEEIAADRQTYSDKYRAAVAGGWTAGELTRMGLSAERGSDTSRPRRRGRQRVAEDTEMRPEPTAPAAAAANELAHVGASA